MKKNSLLILAGPVLLACAGILAKENAGDLAVIRSELKYDTAIIMGIEGSPNVRIVLPPGTSSELLEPLVFVPHYPGYLRVQIGNKGVKCLFDLGDELKVMSLKDMLLKKDPATAPTIGRRFRRHGTGDTSLWELILKDKKA